MFQMINMTGWNGMTFFEPYAMENLRVRFKELNPVSVMEMTADGLKPVAYENGMDCSMKSGELYKAYRIRV